MNIEVVPYDPAWPKRFAEIRSALSTALGSVAFRAIEHVGSTSVPGLAAKPVIDVDVVVGRQLDAAIAALTVAGYQHQGELGIADRHAMRAPPGATRRNVYVVVEGSSSLRNHLAVREALRADPVLRDEYTALKWRLASEVEDISGYLEGKSDLLLGILARAGFTDDEIETIRTANRRPAEPTGAQHVLDAGTFRKGMS